MSDTLGKDGAGGKGGAGGRPSRRMVRRPGGRGPRASIAERWAPEPAETDAPPTRAAAAQSPSKSPARAAAKTSAPPERGGAKASGARKAAAEAPPAWKRREKGFLQAGSLVSAPVQEASSRRGFAETRILMDWPAIAGERLHAVCRPLRISYSGASFGATLVLEVEGARAPELEMQGPQIVERVNAHYGYRAISRIKLTQVARLSSSQPGAQGRDRFPTPGAAAAPSGLAEPETPFRRPLPPGVPQDLDGVEDEGLRAALARLAQRIAARREDR